MAQPLTPNQIRAAFKKWDVKFVERPGWDTHRRDPIHGPWGPVYGGLIHHTGDDAPDSIDEDLLWRGRPDLAGPLCNWGMRDDGTVVLLGGGRANHAGLGSRMVLDHIMNEDYSGELAPGPDTVDGNRHLYGQETMYSGGRPMSKAAYASTLRVWAAICDAHGWTALSVVGHREWTRRKVDPGSFNLPRFRSQLGTLLALGPGSPTPLRKTTSLTLLRKQIGFFLRKPRRPAVARALRQADAVLANHERK